MFSGTVRVRVCEATGLRPTDFQKRHNMTFGKPGEPQLTARMPPQHIIAYDCAKIFVTGAWFSCNFMYKVGVACLPRWVLVLICKYWGMVADDQPIDPYVSIDADEHHLDRSSTKPKTFDPVWNETFIHEVHNVGRYVIIPLIICLTCYS